MSLELDLMEKIRNWLRYHSTYHVSVELYELYQCYWLKVMEHTKTIRWFHGTTLLKQLQAVLNFLHSIDPSDYAVPNKPVAYVEPPADSKVVKDLAKILFLAYNRDNETALKTLRSLETTTPEWEYVAKEAIRFFGEKNED